MAYGIWMKPGFLSDLLSIDRSTQKKVRRAVSELEISPDQPRGDVIKKLTYHDKVWRYRLGDYRLMYAVFPSRRVVQLISIGPRDEVYKRFNYEPEYPHYQDFSVILENTLDPDEETPIEWVNYMESSEDRDTSETLPYLLNANLLTEWKIPEEYHQHFIGCKNEDKLLNCGAPSDHIMRVAECLWPPKVEHVAQQPDLVVEKPVDLDRYIDGDLVGFLLRLDDEQERYVDWALKGPTLVKGGPGSGKSTVALYRMRKLMDRAELEGRKPKILFTTYTNALVGFSKQLLDRLLDGKDVDVEVSTVDRIAARIVRKQDGWYEVAGSRDIRSALTSAKLAFTPDSGGDLERRLLTNAVRGIREDYLIDEFEWVIEGQNLRSLEEYLDIDRTGRGYAFDERMRRAVWRIYEHSKEYLKAAGERGLVTWGDVRSRSLELVQEGKYDEKWDYVIVDEAQDLKPTALALCIELCNDPSGIFLTADASQSIYNQGFSWKRVHENLKVVGRTRILRRNYRSTRQIAQAATSLIRDTNAGDEEVLDQYYVHVGPKPELYPADETEEQFLWLSERIRAIARDLRLPIGAAAILAPTNDLAAYAAQRLCEFGLPTRFMRGRELDLHSPEVKAVTIHSGKGLEFPVVAIPYAEKGVLPRELPDERADDVESHLARERRILFVGCTRAMRRLFITFRREKISTFLESADPSLWEIIGGKLQ